MSAFSHKDSMRPAEVGQLHAKIEGSQVQINLSLTTDAVLSILNAGNKAGENKDKNALPQNLLRDAILGQKIITSDTGNCLWREGQAGLQQGQALLIAVAECGQEPKELEWDVSFIRMLPRLSYLRVTAERAGFRQESFVYRDQLAAPVVFLLKRPNFLRAIQIGLEDAGIAFKSRVRSGRAPFAEGLDHLLFVVILLLLGAKLSQLLKAIGGYFAANSLTMILSLLSGAAIPAQWGIAVNMIFMIVLAAHRLGSKKPVAPWIMGAAYGFIRGWIAVPDLLDGSLGGMAILCGVLGFNIGSAAVQAGVAALLVALLRLKVLYQKRKLSPYLLLIVAACLLVLVRALFYE